MRQKREERDTMKTRETTKSTEWMRRGRSADVFEPSSVRVVCVDDAPSPREGESDLTDRDVLLSELWQLCTADQSDTLP